MRVLTSRTDLLAAGDDAPVIRYDLASPLRDPAYAVEGAVAFVHRAHGHTPGLCVLGAPGPVADLVTQVLDARDRLALPAGADHLTLPVEAVDTVRFRLHDNGFRLGEAARWEWMHTTRTPDVQPGEDAVMLLDGDALWSDAPAAVEARARWQAELVAFLRQHNARTDARPFELRGERWAVVRADGGELVAVGVDEPNLAGQPVLEGITTAPGSRGRGWGAAITAILTRGAVERSGVCTLGMYSDNEVARRLYLRLGYSLDHRFSSHELLRGS